MINSLKVKRRTRLKNKNMRYISPWKHQGSVGFYVRVPNGNKLLQKLFNKNKYGGINKAKQAAMTWRDKILKQNKQLGLLDAYHLRRVPGKNYSNVTNRAAAIGVFLDVSEKGNGEIYYGWTARYMKDGKQRNKYFSVNKYGDDKAFKMACLIRFENCGILYVHDKNFLPCKPPVPYILL